MRKLANSICEVLTKNMAYPDYESIRIIPSKWYYLFNRLLRRPDYLDEILFWGIYLANRPETISNPIYREEAFPKYLRICIDQLKQNRDASLKLLEIGSGPVSILAAGVDEGLFEITAVDPLANVYKKLMKRYGFSYPIKPVKGRGERLVKLFEKNSFDIVYSSNALDHTGSPRQCMLQIYQVLRPGGIIFLEGLVCEGSRAGWTGLHQHDLFIENRELIHFNRAGIRTNLTSDLGLKCLHEKITLFKERQINGFGYEVPPDIRPDDNWLYHDWYLIVFRKTAS